MPSARASRAACRASRSSGLPCTRYSVGVRVCSSSRATATFARIMHSSISRCASIARAQLDARACARLASMSNSRLRRHRNRARRGALRALISARYTSTSSSSRSTSGPSCVARLRLALEQRLVRQRVGEPRGRAHHGRIEARRLQRTLARDDHVRGEAQPIDVRRQRAQVIRQRRRQHRHTRVGKYTEVPRSRASASSAVPGRT